MLRDVGRRRVSTRERGPATGKVMALARLGPERMRGRAESNRRGRKEGRDQKGCALRSEHEGTLIVRTEWGATSDGVHRRDVSPICGLSRRFRGALFASVCFAQLRLPGERRRRQTALRLAHLRERPCAVDSLSEARAQRQLGWSHETLPRACPGTASSVIATLAPPHGARSPAAGRARHRGWSPSCARAQDGGWGTPWLVCTELAKSKDKM